METELKMSQENIENDTENDVRIPTKEMTSVGTQTDDVEAAKIKMQIREGKDFQYLARVIDTQWSEETFAVTALEEGNPLQVSPDLGHSYADKPR